MIVGNPVVVPDCAPPSVSIDQAAGQADPTSSSSAAFTIVFSKPVVGFTAGDVALSGPASAGVTAAISGTGPTYTLTVSNVTAPGALSVSIPAGVATNVAGIPNGASTSTDNTVTFVFDSTAPVITPTVTGTKGSNDWYTSTVFITWEVDDFESSISSISNCTNTFVGSDTTGTSLTCSATSSGGSNAKTVTIKRDATKPTLGPVVSASTVVLGGVATVTPGASDATSGVASSSCGPVNTATVGVKTIVCTATDNAGNTNTANATVTVAYPWSGFLGSVVGTPISNSATAGSTVSLIFNLGGNRGLQIFAAGYPRSQQVNCTTRASIGSPSATVASAKNGLAYDATTGRYTYTWSTDKKWAGQCRILTVKLVDGTEHTANVTFK